MTDTTTQIADRTRGMAAKHRCTQDAIAGILGISRQAVSARFTARVPFAATEIHALSDAWGEPVDSFFPERAA